MYVSQHLFCFIYTYKYTYKLDEESFFFLISIFLKFDNGLTVHSEGLLNFNM